MEHQAFVYDYYGRTTLHPIAAIALVLLSAAILLSSPRRMVIPFLVLACSLTPVQRIVVAGFDFTFLRILIVVGWLKLLLDADTVLTFRMHAADKWMIAFVLVQVGADVIRSMALRPYLLGTGLDALGSYFLFRFTIRNREDTFASVRALMILSIPVALFFVIERLTGRNMFSIFGGVPLVTAVREGRLRCTGAFAHPILAGCFFASTVPMLLSGFWQSSVKRSLWWLSGAAVLLIIANTASSTPIVTLVAGVAAFALYRHRRYIPALLVTILALLLLNSLRTGYPIWHLIARLDIVSGSTGDHRERLIGAWVRNVKDWWLVGMGAEHTADWGEGLVDVTSQYVLVSLQGGLLGIVTFFGVVGGALAVVKQVLADVSIPETDRRLAWGLGVALFSHLVSFISVSYFGQIYILWYLTLALCSGLGSHDWASVPAIPRCRDARGLFGSSTQGTSTPGTNVSMNLGGGSHHCREDARQLP